MTSEDIVLNLALIIPFTKVTGPGTRTCIWLQGCSLKCPGCQNPEYQSHTPRILISPRELYKKIRDLESDGITISGGEPLQQAKALTEFLRLYKTNGKTVIIFTGYSKSELISSKNPHIKQILKLSDCIIAGPYRKDDKEMVNQVASLNKELILLTSNLKKKDFKSLEWEIRDMKEIKEDYPTLKNKLCTEIFFDGSSLILSGKKNSDLISSILTKVGD